MNFLLFFFALPIATILLSIVGEKILRCPILVAITTFAIYLIVTFAIFSSIFLVATIVYTILSYLAACVTEIFLRRNNQVQTISSSSVQQVNNNSCNNCSNCCRRNY